MNVHNPSVAAVILNWNGKDYLEGCLGSLLEQTRPPDTILLIDNGSTDGSVAFVREHYPTVEVRENGGNLGFAAGNNVAFQQINAAIYLLLNPDVVLTPDAVASLVNGLSDDPTLGIAGGKLWYPERRIIQHAGGYITHPQGFPGHYGLGEADIGQHDTRRDVEYVIGAALAIRREVLDRIGRMDEGFFLYYEDVDICARARRAGYRVIYLPEVSGIHIESATAVKGSFTYLQRFHTGRWRYLLKHITFDELTDETLSAEDLWLDTLTESECRAVSLAYLSTIRRLPDIWSAREREGEGRLDLPGREKIETGLRNLHNKAQMMMFDNEGVSRLSAAAVLRERPFESDVPLIGPLIARFRSAWNDVASRWYVAHLMHQQNEFNRLAVAEIARYETELREQMALLEEQVIITAELQDRLQELNAELTDLAREVEGRPGGPGHRHST